jgi:ribonuclease J
VLFERVGSNPTPGTKLKNFKMRTKLIEKKPKEKIIEERTKDKVLKIVPLGGLEEVGRNMTYFEYGDDIIIVDMGLGFPEAETMPGVDFVVPNIESLKNKKEKIRGIFITHGHYDHIGAIPYLIEQIGNPPIYATPLSRGIILRRQEDFPYAPKLEIYEFNKKEYKKINVGAFEVEWFHVNHNIPDSVGFVIRTPVGNILHTGDFKIDFTPMCDLPADLTRIVELSKDITLLMADSTNADQPGHVISEREIMKNLEEIFKEAPRRIFASTFASLIERIQQLIWLSEKYNRKVVIDGYTMKMNTEVAKALGYLKVERFTLISPEEALKLDPSRVTVICTGAQGEDNSVLMRIASGDHKYFKIQPQDTVIFSSSVVPGNERSVQMLKDSLYRQGARVFHYQMMDIHASGHAFREDLKLLISIVKPKYFMPIHGHYFMLKQAGEIAKSLGYSDDQIIIASNGQVIEMDESGVRLLDKKEPAGYVFVDGLGVGDVGEVVLRDRQVMSQDGIFVIVVVIDSQTGRLRTSPDIISRGFVYLRESQELLKEVRALIKKIVAKSVNQNTPWPLINEDFIKNNIKEELGEFLFKKTHRRPMLIPVIIQV